MSDWFTEKDVQLVADHANPGWRSEPDFPKKPILERIRAALRKINPSAS